MPEIFSSKPPLTLVSLFIATSPVSPCGMLLNVLEFVLDRMSSEGDVYFYDRIPKFSLKTLASFIQKSKCQPHVSSEQETATVFAQL